MAHLLSIFTPTYNRATLLPTLFESLSQQKILNFEWIIVDDGSNDDTEQIVKKFKKRTTFPITFFKQKNQGKHMAINKGAELAEGALFFVVDSDDYLVPKATELISDYYAKIEKEEDIAGVSFRRGYNKSDVIGSPEYFEEFRSNVFDFRFRKNISGDMAEVYKTAVIKKFPFPARREEKFCAEGLIWNRIGLSYQLLWTSHLIYICNYLEGGLTDASIKNRIRSPHYAALYYSELSKAPIPRSSKLKAIINYWRFAHYQNTTIKERLRSVNFGYSLLAFPISILLILKDKLK